MVGPCHGMTLRHNRRWHRAMPWHGPTAGVFTVNFYVYVERENHPVGLCHGMTLRHNRRWHGRAMSHGPTAIVSRLISIFMLTGKTIRWGHAMALQPVFHG